MRMKLFGQHVPVPILVLFAAEYGLAAFAFALALTLLVGGGLDLAAGIEGGMTTRILAFSTTVVLALMAVGLYQPKQRLRAQGVIIRLVAGIGVGVLALAVVDLFYPANREGPLWGLTFVLSFGLLSGARLCFGKLVDHEAFRRKVLVYGAGDRAASLLKLRRRADQRGFKLIAFVPAPSSLLDYAREHEIDEIVVAMDERRSNLPIRELLDCRFAGIAVIDLLSFLERETGRVKVDLVNPAWLIFSEGFSGKPARGSASRVLDLAVATVIAVLSLPVMLAVAIAILLEDGRPVLYKQNRVGYGGRVFPLYKFRSMIKNAEAEGRPQWAGQDDPRVTRVGRVIRKLRLDELPQLFNVIRGDMSLVGPRPERPEFVSRLAQSIPYYHERHSVKPGITGWAQLCYPYGSSEGDALEKLQYDLYYVKHRSLAFDLAVILQTVEVVLWGKGAR